MPLQPLNYPPSHLRYHALIGTGGIGAGMFFALNGNHTLGREESRSGCFLDQRDYCKLHIIGHYIKALLGPEFTAIPIGKVSEDDLGHRLYNEMQETGFDMRFVRFTREAQTLNALCFLYPDGTGGNLTMDDSACNYVTPDLITEAEADFVRFQGDGIVLSAAEVPLETRRKLLEFATQYRFLRVANFTTAEMLPALEMGLFEMVDLLGINTDEAAAIIGMDAERDLPLRIVQAAIERFRSINPKLILSITASRQGSWTWDGQNLNHVPAVPVAKVASSAGAGDCHLALMTVGLAVGLSIVEAQQLASLAASLSVTSPHTIHPTLDRNLLRQFAQAKGVSLPENVSRLLE